MLKYWLIIFFLIPMAAIGQDRIVKKNKSVIECKVIEISADKVKYRRPSISADVIFSIEKVDVDYIEFENGNIFRIENPMADVSFYEHNRRTAIMVNIGKQWVFDDSFLVDVYWGLGYGFSNRDEF